MFFFCGYASNWYYICDTVICKTTGLKMKSVFRQSGPPYGPHSDEVFFYHDDSAADRQWLSNVM